MPTENTRGQPRSLYFLVAVCLLISSAAFIVMFLRLSDLKESIVNNKMAGSIITSEEDESFIKKICRDLGLENEITIIVGPHYIPSFFSPHQNHKLDRLLTQYPVTVDPNDPTRKILMEESIYKELNAEQKRGLIAHEIWHMYSFIKNGYAPKLGINAAIEADRFAVRYVSPDILIDLYRTYGNSDPEIEILIDELEKQKLIISPNGDAP